MAVARAAASATRARKILAVVEQIPRGRVATHGQVARLAGLPRNARFVGRILSHLPDERVPWQRVVNAKGEISARSEAGVEEDVQRAMLELEGVTTDERGRIDLERFQWRPRGGRVSASRSRRARRPGP